MVNALKWVSLARGLSPKQRVVAATDSLRLCSARTPEVASLLPTFPLFTAKPRAQPHPSLLFDREQFTRMDRPPKPSNASVPSRTQCTTTPGTSANAKVSTSLTSRRTSKSSPWYYCPCTRTTETLITLNSYIPRNTSATAGRNSLRVRLYPRKQLKARTSRDRRGVLRER